MTPVRGGIGMRIQTQFTVVMKNDEGELQRLAAALAGEEVCLYGLSWRTEGDLGVVRFIAADEEAVERAVSALGSRALRTPVLSVPMANRASDLGRMLRLLEQGGVRAQALYGSNDRLGSWRLVVCADRPERAEKLLGAFTETLSL